MSQRKLLDFGPILEMKVQVAYDGYFKNHTPDPTFFKDESLEDCLLFVEELVMAVNPDARAYATIKHAKGERYFRFDGDELRWGGTWTGGNYPKWYELEMREDGIYVENDEPIPNWRQKEYSRKGWCER